MLLLALLPVGLFAGESGHSLVGRRERGLGYADQLEPASPRPRRRRDD